MTSYKTTCGLTLWGFDVEAHIEFDYSPGRPGTWYKRNGDPGDPPEPDELDVTSVKVDGSEVDLSDRQWEIVEQACYEKVAEENAARDAAEYEHFMNMRKDGEK